MATYVWPENLYPVKFGFTRFDATFRNNSMFELNRQTVGLLNDRWLASVDIGLQSASESRVLEAFVNSLRQGVHRTMVPHFFRPKPLGTLQGVSSLSANALQGSMSFSVLATTGLTIKAGDFFNVGNMLFCAAEDCTAAFGVITIPVVNPSRRPWPTGTAVILSNPTCIMGLTPNSTPKPTYQAASLIGGISLEFVEDVNA